MQKIESRLTIFFDDPFWTGIYERIWDGKLTASKVVFGAEPKDFEVYEYFLQNWSNLRFSPPVAAESAQETASNPKRRQREAGRQLESRGAGTKSQQALKLQHEEGKIARRERSREQKELEESIKFEQRQQKKKEKRRGH
jgi:Protein of unknown function (DUF2992).